VDLLKLIEHPEHVLRVGHHIRGRYIAHRTDLPRHLAHPATANLLLLPRAKIMRIADYSTLRSAERNIHHGAFPRHPHGERAYRIDRLLRVEPDAALARSACIVVLYAETAENLHHPVVHAHRDGKLKFAQRVPQEIFGGGIKPQVFGHFVELGLRDLK
jgi:hypothetical protein